MSRSPRVRRIAALGLAAVLVGGITGCGGRAGSPEVRSPDAFTYLLHAEQSSIEPVLDVLAQGECADANDALPLEISTTPQARLDQQVALLASQDELPVMFAAGGTPSEGIALAEAGLLVDLEEELEEMGLLDVLEPAAVSAVKRIYGGELHFLPYQLAIEGFFYNKSQFAELGIDEPQTWDELMDASGTLSEAGIVPFSVSGGQGWPITRFLSTYLFRSIGPDALEAVAAGDAKLTDPEYVEAARIVADMGAQGYFGDRVTSLDYDGSKVQFLDGTAAMMYMGSGFLRSVTDPEQTLIGVENVGFMPFPAVEGGAGSIDQYPSNVGVPTALSAATFDDDVKAWLGCIVENFGYLSLSEQSAISGIAPQQPVEEVPEITTEIQERIATSDESVLWFEALFPARANQEATSTAAFLITGEVTPEEYMASLQEILETDG